MRALLQTTVALMQLSRVGNLLMAIPAVWMGARLALSPGGELHLLPMALCILVVLCVQGAGNTFNDWMDQEEDRLNRPRRPLPAGRVSADTALAWAGVQAINALVLAWKLMILSHNGTVFRLCLLCILLLLHYGLRGKNTPLAGNLEVALLSALAVYYGTFAVPLSAAPGRVLLLAGFAASLTLLREIIKDVQDLSGDRRAGLHTTAIALGERRSKQLAIAALVPIAALILAAQQISGELALFLALIPGLLCMIAVLKLKAFSSASAASSQAWIKAAIVAGMLIFWALEIKPQL